MQKLRGSKNENRKFCKMCRHCGAVRCGKAVGWGAGAEQLPEGGVRCASGAETVKFLAAEAALDDAERVNVAI